MERKIDLPFRQIFVIMKICGNYLFMVAMMVMEFTEVAEVIEIDPHRRRKTAGDTVLELNPDFEEELSPQELEELGEMELPDIEDMEFEDEIPTAQQKDEEWRSEHGYTELTRAARKGDIDKIKEHLENGANIESVTNVGITPLIASAQDGKLEATEVLLNAGANIEARTEHGKTALILASQNGHAETIEQLLKHGADIDAVDNAGVTSLTWAASRGNAEAVKVLLENGADISIKTQRGNTAMDLAKNQEIRDLLKQAQEKADKVKEKPVEENISEAKVAKGDVEKMDIPDIADIRKQLEPLDNSAPVSSLKHTLSELSEKAGSTMNDFVHSGGVVSDEMAQEIGQNAEKQYGVPADVPAILKEKETLEPKKQGFGLSLLIKSGVVKDL